MIRTPVLVVVLALALVGCSSEGPAESVFAPTPERQVPEGPAATFTPGAAAGAPTSCAPAQLTDWKPAVPRVAKLAQGACAAADVGGFYDACLAAPVDARKCDAFKAAHGACATCIESSDSDAVQGPIVWRSSRAYYTVNIAGCIAAVEGGTMSPGSCGYAYEAALQCGRAACTSCFAGNAVAFEPFSRCQKDAATSTCRKAADDQATACGAIKTGSPEAGCFAPSGGTSRDAYLAVAGKFCSK